MLTTENVDRSKLSDMMLDYVQNKDNYPNDIVLFRVGDFYEAYFQDALPLSQITGIRLTAKKIGTKSKKSINNKVECVEVEESVNVKELQNSKLLIPMAGVPWRNLMSYANKLIQAGRRVVVVEQLEDPKEVKNRNIKRGVVCILSTQDLSNDFIVEYLNNFLCVIYREKNTYSLCFSDISTGDIYVTYTDNLTGVLNEIYRYKPSEIVINSSDLPIFSDLIENKLKMRVMLTVEDSIYQIKNPIVQLQKAFNVKGIEDFDFCNLIELDSICSMLNYISYTQKIEINFNKLPVFYRNKSYLEIDMDSRLNLELTENVISRNSSDRRGTLLGVLDHCKTSMGSRLLKQWIDKPLQSKSKIESRLDCISELVLDETSLDDLRDSMVGILDISRILGRLKTNKSIPRDLVNLRDSLKLLPTIIKHLGSYNTKLLRNLRDNFSDFSDLVFLLDNALVDDPVSDIKEGIVIKAGYNHDLDTARDMESNTNKYLIEFEESEKLKTGIKNLKVCNKNGRCTIEVTKTNLDKVPNYYRVEKALKSSTRFVTDELDKLDKELVSAIERSKSIEIELYDELKSMVLLESSKLTVLCDVLSTLDVLCSLAKVSVTNNYTRPKINTDGYLNIVGGRHPVVERMGSEEFIENNLVMNLEDSCFLLITGPNMAGKSTYMRQNALIVILAHIGCFVPANEADICMIDKIFTRIGASDDISSGRSTYMVEMTEVKNILENATKNSLVLLDEVGRGTSTSDGLAIAQAISEYIYSKIGCKTLFATHYHELISLEKQLKGFKNYHLTVKKENGELIFLRKIERGGLSESYGIDVAQLAGIPESIVKRAWDILNVIESENPRVVDVKEDNSVVNLLKGIDKTTLTPISAYKILSDLIARI